MYINELEPFTSISGIIRNNGSFKSSSNNVELSRVIKDSLNIKNFLQNITGAGKENELFISNLDVDSQFFDDSYVSNDEFMFAIGINEFQSDVNLELKSRSKFVDPVEKLANLLYKTLLVNNNLKYCPLFTKLLIDNTDISNNKLDWSTFPLKMLNTDYDNGWISWVDSLHEKVWNQFSKMRNITIEFLSKYPEVCITDSNIDNGKTLTGPYKINPDFWDYNNHYLFSLVNPDGSSKKITYGNAYGVTRKWTEKNISDESKREELIKLTDEYIWNWFTEYYQKLYLGQIYTNRSTWRINIVKEFLTTLTSKLGIDVNILSDKIISLSN